MLTGINLQVLSKSYSASIGFTSGQNNRQMDS